ncbi:MAG TPA: hypothetical protein VGM77_13945 [Gemmatimonadales bacterium]
MYYDGANDTAAVSRAAYRDQLAWIASAGELKDWDATSAMLRAEWLRQFWAMRDLRDGRSSGSRLTEQFRRLAEAESMYRFSYPARAKGDTLRLLAMPDYSAAISGVALPFHSFAVRNEVLDDRGAIYLRQGIPYLSMRSTGHGGVELWEYLRAGQPLYLSFGASLQIGPPIVVSPWTVTLLKQLDDTALFNAPVALIATVAADTATTYGYRQTGFCPLKTSLCKAFPDSSDYSFPQINCHAGAVYANLSWRLGDPRVVNLDESHDPAAIAALDSFRTKLPPQDSPYIYEREREEGLWSIDHALHSDVFAIPFSRSISPAIAAHVLADTLGTYQLLIAVELLGKDLPHWELDLGRAELQYPERFHVAALREGDLQRFDFDTTVFFHTSKLIPGDGHLSTLFALPLGAGRYDVSIWVQQTSDSSGVLVQLDTISVGATSNQLQLSDLVLGDVAGSALHWSFGTDSIPVAPSNRFTPGASVNLYYQANGLHVGTTYQTRFEFFRAGNKQPSLAVATSSVASAAAMNVTRTLDLTGLGTGQYQRAVIRK